MTKTTSGSSLIDFRTAYLRAIGYVWRNHANRDDPTVQRLLSPTPQPANIKLEGFGCDVAWDLLCSFGYDADGPRWLPGLASGWVGGEGVRHRLTIYLPDQSTIADKTRFSETLAEYYRLRPSPLGGMATGGAQAESGGLHINNFEALNEKLGSWARFDEFGGVLMRALALLWDAEDVGGQSTEAQDFPLRLFSEGKYAPNPELSPDEAYVVRAKNTEQALEAWFGHHNAWNIDIVCLRCAPKHAASGPSPYAVRWYSEGQEPGRWQFHRRRTPDDFGKIPEGEWKDGLPPNELLLHMPSQPAQASPGQQAIALAAYNETGKAYPLTCCAC